MEITAISHGDCRKNVGGFKRDLANSWRTSMVISYDGSLYATSRIRGSEPLKNQWHNGGRWVCLFLLLLSLLEATGK